MAFFDEFLVKVEEADKAILAKYPALKESVDKLETDKIAADAAVAEKVALLAKAEEDKAGLTGTISAWDAWRTKNWNDEAKATNAQVAMQQERDLARTQLEELRAKGDTDMTFAEIEEQLKGRFVTKADVDAAVAARKFVDADVMGKELGKLDAGMTYIYTSTATMPLKHFQEFGKVMELTDLFKFMGDNKIDNPQVAYDQMVAPLRTEKQTASAADKQKELDDLKAKHEADIEAARKQGEETARREFGGYQGDSPVESGHGASGISLTRGGTEAPPTLKIDYSVNKLGDGGISEIIAADLAAKRRGAVAA